MKITINKQRYWNLYILAIIYQNIIIFTMLLQNVKCDWLMECGNCRCKWNSGKKTADCKNLTLNHVPLGLSTEIQVLDLSYNKIKKIEENAFVKTELENLHKLFARNCSMERVHPLSFKGLGILIELDLSNNLIKQLPRDAFSYLIKVRSLVINNNLLETLDNGLIRNLKYLHKIELKENRISRVNTDVFQNVPYLSQIFLNGNQLSFLRKESFEKLKRLASLSLDSNPWNCTCELQVFRDFALKRNLYTPPTSCFYPIHLRGVLWNDEQSGAFACKPKIIYPSKGASINTSKENVTLICRVHASPNTVIAWDYNKQIYSSINYQARVHIQLLREENANQESKEIGRDIFISRLTIIGAEKSDEGIYTCLAENPGGKDEVQMSLLVQKHNAQDMLFNNNLIVVICLMVLGLLSASIFLAMVTCCIYKKFKNLNHRHHHHHHHHHNHHGGSQTSEDSLEHEKRCQAVNSTIVVTNTGDVGYLQHHDTTITDVDQQLEQQQQQQQQKKQQQQNKLKSLSSDGKRNTKLLNGNGLIIDSRISSLTTDLNEKSKKHYDGNNTKDFRQNQQITQQGIAQSNCSPPTTINSKLSSSSKEKSLSNKTSSQFGTNLIQQHHPQKNLEHQIQENKLPEYHNRTSSIGQQQQLHHKDYQPDLLPYKPASQSILLSDSKSYSNSYTILNQSSLYDGDSKTSKLEHQQLQQQQHETSYSNSNSKNSNNNISNNNNNNSSSSNQHHQQKNSDTLYKQYDDQKYQQQLQRLQYQKQQNKTDDKDQNNDIRYASIIPRSKYSKSNINDDNDDDDIGNNDYLYKAPQNKILSGCETGTTILSSTGQTLLSSSRNGSLRALDTLSKLDTLTKTSALNDYLHSGFIEMTTGITSSASPSSSTSGGMMMSNSLNNGFIQQLDSTGISANKQNFENLGKNSTGGVISNTGSINSSNSNNSKLQKYQFSKIASYDDRPPTTILSSTTLGSISMKPSIKSNLQQQQQQQQSYNEFDNNIMLEPGGDIGNIENCGTTTTTTKTIIDDRYYHYNNGDNMKMEQEEEILPHKQSTIVTTSPSLNFLTNYYPRRELL